jgi:hypothetical protein
MFIRLEAMGRLKLKLNRNLQHTQTTNIYYYKMNKNQEEMPKMVNSEDQNSEPKLEEVEELDEW